MTLMCVYVFVSVCLLVMCLMFLWEQGRCELRKAKLMAWLVIGVCRLSAAERCKSNTVEILKFTITGRECLVMPEEGRHLNSFSQIVRLKSQTSKAKFFFCTIRKQISDPQNSCRRYEMLNKGQCSSWKSISFISSVDSIRTTYWLLYTSHHLMLWLGGKFLSIKKMSSFLLNCELRIHTVFILIPRYGSDSQFSLSIQPAQPTSVHYGQLQTTAAKPHGLAWALPLVICWQASAADGHSTNRGLTSKRSNF